jgi:hypothetical protein
MIITLGIVKIYWLKLRTIRSQDLIIEDLIIKLEIIK